MASWLRWRLKKTIQFFTCEKWLFPYDGVGQMTSAHCLAPGHGNVFGVAQAPGKDRVLLTIAGDGVTIQDLSSKAASQSWALGKGALEFSAPAAFHAPTRHLFAAVQNSSNKSDATLLAWPEAASAGTIQQIAHHIPLSSPVTSLLSLSTSPAAAAPSSSTASGGPSSSSSAPAIYVAHTDGTISLCSTSDLLAESAEASGCPLVAASLDGGALLTVHGARSGEFGLRLGRFTVAGGKLQCDALLHAASPAKGVFPEAATHASGSAVILWSDGSLASYDVSSPLTPSQGTVTATFSRRLKGFTLSSGSEKAGGASGKTPGRRKRDKTEESKGRGDRKAAVVHLGEGLVAVVGWAAEGGGVRAVAADAAYGAIQSATNLSAGDLGAGKLDTQKPFQAIALKGTHRAVVAVGGAAVAIELDVRRPSLANLIGALATPFQMQRDAEARGPALAASSALAEDALAELTASVGGGAGPLKFAFGRNAFKLSRKDGKEEPAVAAAELLVKVEAEWEAPGGGSASREAETDAWSALLDAGSRNKGLTQVAFLEIVTPLLAKAKKARTKMSYDLLCKLLLAASESGHWEVVEKLLAAQHPGSMAGCPGLVTALAQAHRYDLLHSLLKHASNVSSADILAVLLVCLSAAATPEAREARAAHAARVKHAAEEIVAAGEAAAGRASPDADGKIAAAACAAGGVDGFSAGQLCLHPLLAAPHDSAVLLSALRKLPAPHAVSLLRYLLRWLRNYRHVIADAHVMIPDLPVQLSIPGPDVVLAWIAAVIDGCMAKLLVRPGAGEVLAELQAEVSPQVAALKMLARVKGAVEHLQCGAPLAAPGRGPAGRYTLEWLSLRVEG